MENVIELNNVQKKFKEFEVKDFSLQVKKGFVTGFVGPNGAGKSTIIKLIMNLMKPDAGEVCVFGENYRDAEKGIKERIGIVFDDNVFFEQLTLKEMKGIIAPSYENWDEGQFQDYIERFELPMKTKTKNFSKGMKMKASLAFALSHRAELIIMDEPTAGLDPVFRRELLEILYDLMQDGEKTIFFSSHITTDLDRIADYITFINDGEHIFTKEAYEVEKSYAMVKGPLDFLEPAIEGQFVSLRKASTGFEGLTDNVQVISEFATERVVIEKATLEDIIYYTKRGNAHV